MQTDTMLGKLMKLLDVLGKELAIELGTDTTTISKWRTGKRKLLYASEYSDKLSQYFLSERFLGERDILLTFLERQYRGFSSLSEKKKRQVLRELLCEKEVPESKKMDLAELQVFAPTTDGWMEGCARFWKEVMEMETPTIIYMYDLNNPVWSELDEEQLAQSMEWMTQAAQQGHIVRFIDMVGENYRSSSVLYTWFSVFMTENMEQYYLMNQVPFLTEGCVYTAFNGGSLVGHLNVENKKDGVFTYYQGSRMQRYYETKVKGYFSHTKELFQKRNFLWEEEIQDEILQRISSSEPVYMLNPVPMYYSMPIDLLKCILERYGISEVIKEKLLQSYEKRQQMRKKSRFIQIYDRDEMEKQLEMEQIPLHSLSKALKKEMVISREEYGCHLAHVAELTEKGELEVYISSFRELEIKDVKLEISVQENRFLRAWDSTTYDTLLFCVEPTFVGANVIYMQELINRIHPIQKNADWTAKQLRKYKEQCQ